MKSLTVIFAETKDLDLDKFFKSNLITDQDYDRLTRIKNEEVQREQCVSTYFKRKYIGFYRLNEYGKPVCDNMFFNISHTKGMVVFVIDSVPVGIDIEKNRKIEDSFKKYVCSPFEEDFIKKDEDFFKVWTNKESLVKCLGTGIKTKVNEIPSLPLNEIRLFKNHIFNSVTIEPSGFIISVTRENKEPFKIELLQEKFSY